MRTDLTLSDLYQYNNVKCKRSNYITAFKRSHILQMPKIIIFYLIFQENEHVKILMDMYSRYSL